MLYPAKCISSRGENNPLPKKFNTLDFTSLSSHVQKHYKAEITIFFRISTRRFFNNPELPIPVEN